MGLRDLLRTVREKAAALAQAVLLPAGLFLAYFVGLGLTWLLARLLRPGFLRPAHEKEETFWREVEGRDADEENARRQS